MATADRALFEVVGLDKIKTNIKTAATVLQGGAGTSFFTKATTYVYRFVLKNFQSQGQQVGGWAELADTTKAWKAKHGHRMILQNKGYLKNNWKPMISPQEGRLVSGTNYGIYHDSDKPRKKRADGKDRLPRRRILPTNNEMREPFMKILEIELTTALNNIFK
jgi:hypothetical protein